MVALAVPSVAAGSRTLTVDAAQPVSATNFATIQAAIDTVPSGNTQPTVIAIAPGRYTEHVSIPRGRNAITLRGAGTDRTKVWIGHGSATHDEHATLSAEADDLTLENLTVENTAGPTAGPQMAVYTSGKRQVFENVLVKGWQDTLGIWDGAKAYFHNCDIWGSVDFIYSGGTAVFDRCDITEIRDTGGDLTAPSTPASVPYGLVFLRCHCKAAPGVQSSSTGLMRPWRPSGMSAFIDCTLDADLSARGWDPWEGRENTCRAEEYGSRTPNGKPIDMNARASWVHRLTAAEAAQYTPAGILGDWVPAAPTASNAARSAIAASAADTTGDIVTKTADAPTSWASGAKVKIVLAGDSTVTDNAGWATGFKDLLKPGVQCINLAKGGRSSKSFRDEGSWAKALALKPDYVLIQFGHNDQPGHGPARETDPNTTYFQNMARYVDEARAAGIQPILVTPLTRREFGPDGKIHSNLAPYAEAVRKVAAEKKVPLVDLQALSIAYFDKLGPKGWQVLAPTKSTGYDGTHLNHEGSERVGRLVADALRTAVPALAADLN